MRTAPQPAVDIPRADGPPFDSETAPPPNESVRWRTRITRHLDTDEERAILAETSGVP